MLGVTNPSASLVLDNPELEQFVHKQKNYNTKQKCSQTFVTGIAGAEV